MDSSLTAISLIAQWMMARKYVENWLLWISADFFYTGMYFYKGLYGTSILYFLLLLLAIKGYQDWKKSQDSIM
jgi:nicotinamide mononucleotide transporter